jgi:hypothetical protein
MNVVEPGSAGANLVARASAILMRPHETWDLIDAETTQIPDLYKTYVAPLAAIPAVCGAIGLLGLGGIHIFGVHLRPSFTGVISEMVVSYVLTLVGVYILALVIDELAPQFGAARGRTQAFKLAPIPERPGGWRGSSGCCPGSAASSCCWAGSTPSI